MGGQRDKSLKILLYINKKADDVSLFYLQQIIFMTNFFPPM